MIHPCGYSVQPVLCHVAPAETLSVHTSLWAPLLGCQVVHVEAEGAPDIHWMPASDTEKRVSTFARVQNYFLGSKRVWVTHHVTIQQ